MTFDGTYDSVTKGIVSLTAHRNICPYHANLISTTDLKTITYDQSVGVDQSYTGSPYHFEVVTSFYTNINEPPAVTLTLN